MNDKDTILLEAIGDGRESVKSLIDKGMGITIGLYADGIRYRLNKLVSTGHLIQHKIKPARRKLAGSQFGNDAPSTEYSKVTK